MIGGKYSDSRDVGFKSLGLEPQIGVRSSWKNKISTSLIVDSPSFTGVKTGTRIKHIVE